MWGSPVVGIQKQGVIQPVQCAYDNVFSENLISQSRQIPNLLTQLSEPKSNPRQKYKKNVLLISM